MADKVTPISSWRTVNHEHVVDVNMRMDLPELPVVELERLLDKATDSALMIITALTVSHVVKSIFNKGAL